MKLIILILFLFLFSALLEAQNSGINLVLDANYPRWLNTDNNRTDQTSGITFIKSDCGEEYFLLADDIGAIHLLKIKDDTLFTITNVSFSDSVQKFLNSLPKADIEEIIYDRNEDLFYISIEGNGKDFKKDVGIYKIEFKNSDFKSLLITSIRKVIFNPQEEFLKFTKSNIGYEGVAVDDNYFYLGLEGFTHETSFDDSTLIYIARKSDHEIIKTFHTKQIEIHTVCGLFSDKDFSIWGIDRNNRKIFHIEFDESFNIKNISKFECSTAIPNYPKLSYLPSFESITIDNQNNLYIVDDPWKEVYVPKQDILDKLDRKTIKNFKEFVPTFFKYTIINP